MKKIRLLDAFAGIGGFHLGVKQACADLNIDFECVGAIEIDKKAQQTYIANHSINGQMYSDITKIDVNSVPDHDILTGGFPCQPFSVAGLAHIKNAGTVRLSDDRSNLWINLYNLLLAKRPPIFVFENVSGLASIKNEDGSLLLDTIKSSLIDLGYNVSLHNISPHNFNLPQIRDRIYIVGTLDKKDIVLKHLPISKAVLDLLEDVVPNSYYLETLLKGQENKNLNMSTKDYIKTMGRNPPDIYRQYLPLKYRYDAMKISYDSKQKPSQRVSVIKQTARIEGDTPSGFNRQRDRCYSSYGLSPTLNCTNIIKISEDHKKGRMRQLTPREYARLQGFPDSFKLCQKDNCSYHQFGNAVCTKVVENVFTSIIK